MILLPLLNRIEPPYLGSVTSTGAGLLTIAKAALDAPLVAVEFQSSGTSNRAQ